MCFEPVREFSVRAPLRDPDSFVGIPRPTVTTSRWRSSASTFGPGIRLAVTGVLLLTLGFVLAISGPLSPVFWIFLWGWVIFSWIVLRDMWRAVQVEADGRGLRAWQLRQFPRFGRQLPAAWTLVIVVPLFLVGGYLWLTAGTDGRHLTELLGILLLVCVVVARSTR